MFILDTNVISELRRPAKANPKVLAWAAAAPAEHMFLSAITILEIEFGALLMERKNAAKGKELRDWIDVLILPQFSGRILPVDTGVAQCCARLHVPATRAQRDALIAATAVVHAMTVVTRNVGDFAMPGVKVMNPWG